jgi:hypothetical protein
MAAKSVKNGGRCQLGRANTHLVMNVGKDHSALPSVNLFEQKQPFALAPNGSSAEEGQEQ